MFLRYIPYNFSDLNLYEYYLNQFLAFLQDHECSTELSGITKTQVRRFIQYQLGISKQKPRSMNRKISCLKSFVSQA
ncbi:site-specific integrase [Heyndrickxia oleronia]|uniref:Site-specific integrase n=1 Tax=Heyndrickxia oleronia TaxID=38875 RepID=A0AAW6STU8_9BACI|nr:site-specific integrase [Heyndrickxia oleronia]MDH5159441.1 site-specific integrase [Heyndrickxia oleronia]